ncbi:MAG: hypothetical protein JW944_06110 [Deltaproteobacteria bacterium]|nr:hypothetical protein [Deltaproteobacteria bacterium]
MRKFSLIIFFFVLMINFMPGGKGLCDEPTMSTYTSYPIFQTTAVPPNIMIMLDNSGSMNFAAYGKDPQYGGGLVTDDSYGGEGYSTANRTTIQKTVSLSSDDAQELITEVSSGGTTTSITIDGATVDIGRRTTTTGRWPNRITTTYTYTTGLRFTGLDIPQGVNITNAYIKFRAYGGPYSNAASMTIKGLVDNTDDNPDTFTAVNGDISGRSTTVASVSWPLDSSWSSGNYYNSPDLSDIVQEFVNDTDWGGTTSEKTLAFKITWDSGSYRRAYSYDTSTNSAPTLYVEYEEAAETTVVAERYYGYFNPEYFYTYNTTDSLNRFEHAYKKVSYSNGVWTVIRLSDSATTTLDSAAIESGGLWDGNWMNWLCMRRIDVLKKVLIGGKASEDTDHAIIVSGEDPAQTTRYYQKEFSAGTTGVSPYPDNTYFGVRGGYLYLNTSNPTAALPTGTSWDSYTKFKLDILKQPDYDTTEFEYGELVGILQRIGDKARWGNIMFNSNTSYNGGEVLNRVGTNISTVVQSLSDEVGSTSTPLAETFYTGVRHFMQQGVESGASNYESGCTLYSSSSHQYDPYYLHNTDGTYTEVACAKSYFLLLTDGASTSDLSVPSYLQDYDGDGNDSTFYSGSGSDYLDDIAYYAHINDLRSPTLGKSDLEGIQNLTVYAVLAFDDDENAVSLLKDTAINGGFIDKNATEETGYMPKPDLVSEWDEDNDGVPDTFYKAADGYVLETELLSAINDILKRAASGTAVSVLATSSEGEGNLIQAYFKPVIPSGLDEITWGGFIQSLWVDAMGNLREDTNQNQTLDVSEDNIISYFTDDATGDTKVNLWYVSEDVPYPDITVESIDEELEIDDITPIWEGARQLSERNPDNRDIFTYLDTDDDDVVDEGEITDFSIAYSSSIMPYLGVKDSSWSEIGSDEDLRAQNIVNYIRGTDITEFRTRTLDNKVWKLGDIIHSTPVSVSKPMDNYHIIYGDEYYGTYYKNNLNRETVIYVGANDGMLHAFTSGVYDPDTKKYEMPDGATETFGDELWAYIPQALLPHLKWLADPDYTHVFYVDLKPKVFDARIDTDDNGIPDTWKTLLLLGLNLGGKAISATGDFDYDSGTSDTTRTFSSSYTLLDITDPRDPDVLWERSYDDLELTTSFPAVIKVGLGVEEKWFAVFGSGPSEYDGTSTKSGHVFVVDLSTGEPYQSSSGVDWLFATSEINAFMNSPVSVDVGLDYNVDAVYFGEAYYDSSETVPWRGKLYKMVIPWVDSGGDYDGDNTSHNYANYSNNPLASGMNQAWQLVPLLDATRPITSSVSLSMDTFDNVWIFVGSGRYFSLDDKTNIDQQYMFGVKDPFYNVNQASYYHDYTVYKELLMSDLLDSDPYLVLSDGTVYLDLDGDGLLDYSEFTASPYGNWYDLLAAARAEDGWIRSLTITGERITTKFTILGGIVFTPSYVPNADICGYGGNSYLYGQYYETGTAYYKAGLETYELVSGEEVVATQMLDKTGLGLGMASSVGVHVGSEEGAKGFIQTSSGTIVEQELETAFNVKSGLRSWMEK